MHLGGGSSVSDRRIRDWEVSASIPGRSGGKTFSPGSAFFADSDFGIRSTPVDTTVACKKDPRHFAKGVGDRLQLNTRTRYVCGFDKVTL